MQLNASPTDEESSGNASRLNLMTEDQLAAAMQKNTPLVNAKVQWTSSSSKRVNKFYPEGGGARVGYIKGAVLPASSIGSSPHTLDSTGNPWPEDSSDEERPNMSTASSSTWQTIETACRDGATSEQLRSVIARSTPPTETLDSDAPISAWRTPSRQTSLDGDPPTKEDVARSHDS